MAAPKVVFRTANNEDWRRRFSIKLGGTTPPPWSGLPLYIGGAPYRKIAPASCVVAPTGDLYVANPASAGASWTGATTFAADLADGRWLRVGSAEAYAQIPYYLTGCSLDLALRPSTDGATFDGAPAVLHADMSSGLTIINASQGGIMIEIPASKTRGVAAGQYGFDIIATHAGGKRVRVAFGLWLVDQGVNG